jgi:hypothetical protein
MHHASIRRYHVTSAKEVTRLVNEGFVPIISRAPGFIAYYGVEGSDGTWASLSIFETQAQADESNRMAADFVKQNLSTYIKGTPDTTRGDLVCDTTS